MIRAKFLVESVKKVSNSAGKISHEEITARAVYGDSEENKTWSRWTPAGQFSIQISNPEAFDKLLPGTEIYIDVSAVSPAA